jgi:hypothetical protein
MHLQDYLQAIEKCPDSELKSELGIYDNFPILLKFDYQTLLHKLPELDFTTYQTEVDRVWCNYNPGTITMQVNNGLRNWQTFKSSSAEHHKRQTDEFNIALVLHYLPELPLQIPNVSHQRALGIVVAHISHFAIQNQIHLCIRSKIGGYRPNMPPEELNKIIYYKS